MQRKQKEPTKILKIVYHFIRYEKYVSTLPKKQSAIFMPEMG